MYHGQRWIGGWRWTAKLQHWFRSLPKLDAGARSALESRRLDHCRRRVLRWQRANMIGGRPTRKVPRNIKEKMRDARAVRP